MADDDIDNSEHEAWDSPSHDAQAGPQSPRTPKTPRTPRGQGETLDPEAALRKELQGVRHINEVIEGVIETLERAGGNMDVRDRFRSHQLRHLGLGLLVLQTVSQTVNNASTLLNSWTRILSQTEHNQRLILHPGWKGATEDMAEQEAEALQKQQAAERRAAEEEQRREDIRRRREEEEEKRRLAAAGPTRRGSTRGTTRTRTRGASTRGTSSGYGAEGASSTRGTSNIGRGFGAARGRARGTRGAS